MICKNKNSFKASIILILMALVIVTGAKMIPPKKNNISPSYGFQESSSAQTEEKTQEIIYQEKYKPGTKIDEYKGVAVYSNGSNYMSSHGLSFSLDGYYYGYEWQCVEYVKRFYYERFGHKMPDGAGHAKYFFNPMLEQGELNKQRGLKQYHNGEDMKPRVDDLLVFNDGAYGHVAIISQVEDEWVEVIQQNSEVTRQRLTLEVEDGKYILKGEREPAGWLRI